MSVVLGYDGTPAARSALAVACDLARRYDAPVVVVYAVEPPGANVGEELRAHRAALEEAGRRVTDEALELARGEGVEAEAVLVAERPVSALLDVAEQRDARLVVVGTYGESPLRGAILGSTPHKLLQLSPRPVLVVPAGRPPV